MLSRLNFEMEQRIRIRWSRKSIIWPIVKLEVHRALSLVDLCFALVARSLRQWRMGLIKCGHFNAALLRCPKSASESALKHAVTVDFPQIVEDADFPSSKSALSTHVKKLRAPTSMKT